MKSCRDQVSGIWSQGLRRVVAIGSRAAITAVVSLLIPDTSYLQSQSSRAERTNYTETSTHEDVVAFIDSLAKLAPGRLHRGMVARTASGRVLPYVVVSRPLVRDPGAARATGKPIVYIQGDIHGGEVEGKESLQAILRDLVLAGRPNVLDSLILIVVPIYNADGNDSLGAQARNRGAQNGPELVGQRANGEGRDLNRDYIKAEAPETQGSLEMFRAWDPDVFVDLHTTNGSFHGYGLTYSPSLHPAAMVGALAPAGPWTRDTLLPTLRARVRARHGLETFDYGNFRGEFEGRDDPTSLRKGGWETYEHKPRFGSNYYGLRNRISVLAEAYSHDPFARRVEATTQFVRELLSLLAEQRTTVLARTRGAMRPAMGAVVPIRAEMTTRPFTAPVLVEALEATGDSVRYEAGLRPGFRRTNRFVPVEMPVFDRFDATRTRTLPEMWVIDASQRGAIELLTRHGFTFMRVSAGRSLRGEEFIVDSIIRAPRPFQGHQETRVEGHWRPTAILIDPASVLVSVDQNNAILAAILLEPESDDGLTTWNFFDSALTVGARHPVRRTNVLVRRGAPR